MEKRDAHGKPVPFSIEFWTADRKLKTGGELLALEGCILSKNQKYGKAREKETIVNTNPKKQNHWENSTRNLVILSSGQIRKCHIRLIEKFNGQNVYW